MALLVARRIEVRAYDRDLALTGVVVADNSDASSASFTVRLNGIGTGNVTLPVSHKMVPVLLQPGARLRFYYWHNDSLIEQMSGPVVATAAGMDARGATITYTAVSDDVLLKNLAWPVPTAGLASQTLEYDTNTGAVDQQVYTMVSDNLIDRLGLPVRMVHMFFTGPTATVKARFHTLAEVVYPALEAANRGIKIYQWNPGDPEPFLLTGLLSTPCLLVEIYTPADKGYVTWTPLLGITSGTASTTAPTATRVIVGGQGEGTARTFAEHRGTLQDEWGPLFVREVFVDARDATDAATLAQRGAEGLAAGGPSGALTAITTDGEPWLVGNDYNRGDRVRIAAVTGEVISTEPVRSITFTVTGKDGVRVIPQIGDPSSTQDPDEATARILRNLGSRLSALESRR